MSQSPTMKLGDLLSAIPVEEFRGSGQNDVRGVTVDSRRVTPGFVFVAIRGQKADGHRFIGDAIQRGAVAVVSESPPRSDAIDWVRTTDARRAAGLMASRLAGDPSSQLELVGITGTNGKTTTAYLLDRVFERLAPPTAMMGTVIHHIGDESWQAKHTTPESPELQTFLRRAVDAGCRFGVLEVSSHGLALGRLEGTQFACTIFTNLSRDHLDFHRDMEEYFAAKRTLFERHLKKDGVAVVCIDDAFGRRLAKSLGPATLTYGFSPDARLRVEEIKADFDGLRFQVRDEGKSRRLRSRLVGRHNALNFLGAYAATRVLGLDSEPVLEAMETLGGAPGRYEQIVVGQPFQVIVDYAHTDDALRNVLESMLELPHRRILTVFGCGGDRDRTKRPLMGTVAARLSDVVILTSDNPRTEDPMAIIREIELGVRGPRRRADVRIEPDRRKAIELALSLATPGDVVVIAGKGHEPYQTIGERTIAFDDRRVAREFLLSHMEPVKSG